MDTETLRQRWARQDAFIGPNLPAAWPGYWEERPDRAVLTCGGTWYAVPRPDGFCQGPFRDIIEARAATLERNS